MPPKGRSAVARDEYKGVTEPSRIISQGGSQREPRMMTGRAFLGRVSAVRTEKG